MFLLAQFGPAGLAPGPPRRGNEAVRYTEAKDRAAAGGHFREAPKTPGNQDLSGCIRSSGSTSDPIPEKNFLQTPLRYRSRQVGSFLPGKKKDGYEFTGGDAVTSYWGWFETESCRVESESTALLV